jgi:polysaccharide pyruvyl transferase WcaK-like protein
MLLAVADSVLDHFSDACIEAFSPYPAQDRQLSFVGDIVQFTPKDMLLTVLPQALLSLLTMRRWRPKGGVAGHLARSNVAVDVSGIAFMDGRGLATLVYNVLLVLLPWAFGVPVVKMAQALGPFRQPLNRISAHLALRRVKWIGLRGSQTERHVATLGLTNAERAADVSFLLRTDSHAEEAARSWLKNAGEVTIIAPSAVIEQQSRAYDIDYVARVSRLAADLQEHGHRVLIVAHSARSGAEEGRTNDLPVCRRIAEASGAALIDRELEARELRALIGRSRLLITSRFHAMISGLATMTPTFVVGWSHKYAEVLSEFGLERWSVDFRDVTDAGLLEEVLSLDRESHDVRSIIQAHLPSVRLQAERNLVPLIKTLSGTL